MRHALSAALIALLWCTPVAAQALIFSPLPMEPPQTVASQWKPFLTYLEERLGVAVEIDYSLGNDEIIEKFKAGKLDIAYFGPLPYVKLKSEFPAAEPLITFHEKDGQPFYTCAVISSGESQFSLENLRDKRFALTQPLSTCGFFATQGLLQQHGSDLEDNLYRYIGQHDEVALSVVRGEFDVGGLKTAIAKKYAHLGLKVLGESASLPGLAIVANTECVSPELVNRIREVVLSATDEERELWGDNIRNGVSPVSDRDYAGVRELVTSPIPEQGNF